MSTVARRVLIFVLFTCAYFLSFFFRSANAVIAGDLAGDLALDAAALGLMTSLFYAGFSLVQLPIGAGLDRLGARYVTPAMLLFSVAGALIFAGAQSFWAAALGRTLIGVGMASVLMGAFKIFGSWFPAERLATFFGFLVGIGALGGLAAATPLALLNEAVGWRVIFSAGALVILAVALAILLLARNTPPETAWVAARGPIATGFGAIFGALRFWRAVPLVFCLLGTPLAIQTLWGGPFARDVLGLDVLGASHLLLAMGLGTAMGYFGCGWLSDRFGAQRVTQIAALGLIVCLLPFSLGGRLAPGPLWYLIYFGVGACGAFNIVLLAQVRGMFPVAMSGRVATALNFFAFLGAWLTQWWMGLMIDSFARDAAGRYSPLAYAAAFGFTAVLAGAALLWYLPLAAEACQAEGVSG
jgi:sugar phosphate permease